MNSLLDVLSEGLRRRARPLHSIGLEEVSWSRQDALHVLDELAESRAEPIAVLGGDVYLERHDHVEPDDSNWYCERRSGEPMAAFARRSREAARAYLLAYPDTPEARFVLVVDDEVTAGL